jgi:hypothetical protein
VGDVLLASDRPRVVSIGAGPEGRLRIEAEGSLGALRFFPPADEPMVLAARGPARRRAAAAAA